MGKYRPDALIERHSEEELRGPELAELQQLVAQVELNDIHNAQRLTEHRRHLRASHTTRQPDAAD